MTENFPETDNFGLTRVGEGDSQSKNSYGVSDSNVVVVDRLLKALTEHDHTGVPRLADPVDPPTLTVSESGGQLPAATTFYYQVSYEDAHGLETAAGPEASITTPEALGVPQGPVLSVETTGGTLASGTHRYVLTAVTTGGGETTSSVTASQTITSGTTNRILITLPELPVAAVSFKVYRARPGQTQYFYWRTTSADSIYDDGTVTEDTTIVAPSYNTSSATNSVLVTLPGGVTPAGVTKWRIYRTTIPGNYFGSNLVHLVSEGLTEDSIIPRPDWVDDGSAPTRGRPRRLSATIGTGVEISSLPAGGTAGQVLAKVDGTDFNAQWVDGGTGGGVSVDGSRSWSAFIPGTIEIGKVYAVHSPLGLDLRPSSISLSFLDAPVTDPDGAQVGFEVVGNYGARWIGSRAPLVDGQAVTWLSPYPYTAKYASSDPDLVGTVIVDSAASEADNGDHVVVMDAQNEGVTLNFGLLLPGRYVTSARVRAPGSGARITDDFILRAVDAFDDSTIAERSVNLDRTTGYAYYYLTFEITTGTEVKIRFFKSENNSNEARLDMLDLETLDAVPLPSSDATPLLLRATLVDPVDNPPHPPDLTVGDQATTELHVDSAWNGYDFNTVLVREGMETTAPFTVRWGFGESITWTAGSDQAWCTLDDTGGTGTSASFTATVDFSTLTAGARDIAIITVSAAGKADLLLYVVALSAPTVLGGNCNVVVGY